MKTYCSTNYNYAFNQENGNFWRWGETEYDDPDFSPIGPEILDLEVSTICSQGCKFCYKSNTKRGQNMSFETFKTILDKMPTIMQVAFGIGDIDANPDLWNMMWYCRQREIVPNITISGFGLTAYSLRMLSKYCGAVAVSNYDLDVCLNAITQLRARGLEQTNIHQFLSEETLTQCWELATGYVESSDPRFQDINAIVFLSVKQEGRGKGFTPVSRDDFDKLIDFCLGNQIPIGFDSCGAHKFLRSIQDHPRYDEWFRYVEPCESGLFSSYVNVEGKYFPCSFAESYTEGIDILEIDNFLDGVWFDPKTVEWRERLLNCNRNCPLFTI